MNTSPNETTVLEDKEFYAAYFDNGADYYTNKLERFNAGEKYVFNGYAFFFGIFWFMYRKMYWEALIIVIIIVVEGVLEGAILGTADESVQTGVGRIVMLVIAIVIRMIGNTLYFKKSLRMIAKAKQLAADPESLLNYLKQKGGVSYWFMLVLIGGLAAIIWYFYNQNN